MIDTIRETIETGDEHSFFMCIDEKGNLSATPKTR